MMVEKIEWYRAIEFLVFIIPRTLVISYTPYLDMVLELKGKMMKGHLILLVRLVKNAIIISNKNKILMQNA